MEIHKEISKEQEIVADQSDITITIDLNSKI
jgi:hypothetical protein